MKNLALTLLLATVLVALLGGVARAEDEEPAAVKELKRGFAEGTFVDEYFGIVYAVDGLKEGFGFGAGGNQVLWSGRLPGSADVELRCREGTKELTALQCRDEAKASWAKDGKTRTDMESGDTPVPWVVFVQESLAGFERHHGWAFYARGHQCFMVHVQVRERTDTSGDAIRKAIQALKVEPTSDSMLLVHVIAKTPGAKVTDPMVLLQAGNAYLQEGTKNPTLALRALEKAKEGESSFDEGARWSLYQLLGLAQLTAGQHETAVETWKRVIALAADTADPAASRCNAQYNLACAYSLMGRMDDAFETLKASFESGGEAQVGELKTHAQGDPDLENMRKDARWAELVGSADAE